MNDISRTLIERIKALKALGSGGTSNEEQRYFGALNIAALLYGPNSPQVEAIKETRKRPTPVGINAFSDLQQIRAGEMRGILEAMLGDIEVGLVASLESRIQSEVFADFVVLAKKALDEGSKDVAAVLTCAALEDSLKRYGTMNGLDVQGKVMQEVVNALKAKGLVAGAQKGLLDAFPKIRDYAMHANWDKIAPEDIRGIIGFVEQFLLTKFSAPSGIESPSATSMSP